MTKTMGVAPPTSKRVQQTLDSDLPHVIDADVDGVHAFEESEDSDDSMPAELEFRGSFAPPAVRPAVGGPKTSRKASETGKSKLEVPVVDLMSDNILPASTVAGLPMLLLIWNLNAVSCSAFHTSWLQKTLLMS